MLPPKPSDILNSSDRDLTLRYFKDSYQELSTRVSQSIISALKAGHVNAEISNLKPYSALVCATLKKELEDLGYNVAGDGRRWSITYRG